MGNLDLVTQPNGVIHDYLYNDLNRLDMLTVTKAKGNKLFEQDYALLISSAYRRSRAAAPILVRIATRVLRILERYKAAGQDLNFPGLTGVEKES